MADKQLSDLAETMREIDFAMLVTSGSDGATSSRPMSNNRDVEYDGDSWFFTCEDTQKVRDLRANSVATLTMQGKSGLLGKPPIFIGVHGQAELIDDKGTFADHWNPDLERWFKQGIDTPGLLMIRVRAERIFYWDGEDQGEIVPGRRG